MPTYDYKCNKCKHSFELFQHITEKSIKKCPACAKMGVERIIGSGGAIIFKGSGFYQTDYRSEEYKSKVKKESESTKPDTKAAEKTNKNNAKN